MSSDDTKKRQAAENRAWAEANMPDFCRLFDGLKAAGMSPRIVKLERFHEEPKAA